LKCLGLAPGETFALLWCVRETMLLATSDWKSLLENQWLQYVIHYGLPFVGGLLLAYIRYLAEQRRFMPLIKDPRQKFIYGRWDGELRNPQSPRPADVISISFPRRFWSLGYWLNPTMIKGTLNGKNEDEGPYSYDLKGGFFAQSNLMFYYREKRPQAIDLGTMFLTLDPAGNTFEGKFVGHWKEIIRGDVKVVRKTRSPDN
jgi:hypothetical protein